MQITSSNYFSAVNPALIAKYPGPIKEAHDLAQSLQNDGQDPFTTGDNDINDVMEALLKAANSFSYAPKNTEPKRFKNTQTNENKAQSTPSKAKKAKTPTGNSVAKRIAKKARVKRVQKTTSTAAAPTKVAVPAKQRPAKTARKKAQRVPSKNSKKVVVKTVKVKEPKAPVTVKKLSKELQIIKSFVAMNGKRYKAKFVEFKHADVAKFLPNAVDHKSVITEVAMKLGNAVKAIKASNLAEITLNIDQAFLTKCTNLVKNAKVRVRTEFLSGVDELGCACDETPKKAKRK